MAILGEKKNLTVTIIFGIIQHRALQSSAV